MNKMVTCWVIGVLSLVGLLAALGGEFLPHPAGRESSGTLIDGHFSLTDATGKTVTNASFPGKSALVFFGYTHCPDICPTTLLTMQKALEHLGKKADNLQPIFISVDPERDTPKIVGEYAAHFGPSIVGLSGSAEQLKQTADRFHIYYRKVVNDNPAMGYMMDHSAFIYLIDPDGRYLAHFTGINSPQDLEEALRKYLD